MLVEAGPLRGENQRLLLARTGNADRNAQGLLSVSKRKTSARREYFAFRPEAGRITRNRDHDHDLLRIVIVSFDVSLNLGCRFGGFLMRAFLGILLTVWLTLLVSHPAFAEKRVRPEAKQAFVRRSQEPTSPPTTARPPLPAGEREKGCNSPAVITTGRPCD